MSRPPDLMPLALSRARECRAHAWALYQGSQTLIAQMQRGPVAPETADSVRTAGGLLLEMAATLARLEHVVSYMIARGECPEDVRTEVAAIHAEVKGWWREISSAVASPPSG